MSHPTEMQSNGYAREAARRVFADGTIWWRAVVLSAVQLIPILGAFVVTGYMMIAMRDAARRVDQGLPRFNQRGEILRRGLDGFIVSLVWTLPLVVLTVIGVIGLVLLSLPAVIEGAPIAEPPWWLTLAIGLPLAILTVFVDVAILRAAVYLKASAGLSIRGVRELIRMNRHGFKYVAWLPVATIFLGLLLTLPGTLLSQNPELPAYATLGLANLSSFVVGMVTVPLHLIVMTAYGLWGSETDPATWPPLSAERRISPTVNEHGVVGDDPL